VFGAGGHRPADGRHVRAFQPYPGHTANYGVARLALFSGTAQPFVYFAF
jgi:hypothetical protein